MGQVTPNISIFIPTAGETNYDASFASGMMNIDQHNHTGSPTGGALISTTGLTDGSVTYKKLNANVADTATGIGVDPVNQNKLQILGLLRQIYALDPLSNGELIIGSTGLAPAKAIPNAGFLSSTTGISVTAGAGSLLFQSTFAVAVRWVDTTIAALAITPGMRYCVIECLGGGGGGGGANTGAGVSGGGGGGAGEYSRAVFTKTQVGTAYNVVIGAAGTAGAATANGGDGGATSVTSVGGTGGVLIVAAGGKGGVGTASVGVADSTAGGLGGTTAPDGKFRVNGCSGGNSFGFGAGGSILCSGGVGAPSCFGGSNIGVVGVGVGTSINGNAALSYGAGGGGGISTSGAAPTGGVGFKGVVIITEYN